MKDLKLLTDAQLIKEFDNAKRLEHQIKTKYTHVDSSHVLSIIDEIKKEFDVRGISEPKIDPTVPRPPHPCVNQMGADCECDN